MTLDEIKARHEAQSGTCNEAAVPASHAHTDRAWLIAEVERLQRELLAVRLEHETYSKAVKALTHANAR